MFKQQGAIRALGTTVIAAHPQLAEVLDRHGLTLDPVTGGVAELAPFNQAMSKRAAQVQRKLNGRGSRPARRTPTPGTATKDRPRMAGGEG